MFDGFYEGKRVFLTGHTGFKGAWLAMWLRRMGAEVGAYSLEPPSTPSLWELAGVEQDVVRLGGDICDCPQVQKAMQDFRPDLVMHMAAQSLVRPSYESPLETFNTNVMGTANILEGVRSTESVKAAVIVTSDKCYENREWSRGYKEDDAMGGHDPYSASKGCAELVTSSYRNSFFNDGDVAVASVRAGNVIGGGDFALDRLIPDIARAFAVGEPVHIRSPYAVRPWQHVLEPLHGYLLLAMKLLQGEKRFAGGWNFGPDEESTKTVGEVVESCTSLWGEGAKSSLDQGNHPHEASLLKLDCAKARQELGWKPKTDFTKALEMSIQWYKDWFGGGNARELSLEQIVQFEEL